LTAAAHYLLDSIERLSQPLKLICESADDDEFHMGHPVSHRNMAMIFLMMKNLNSLCQRLATNDG
jgi:hypothetical protein